MILPLLRQLRKSYSRPQVGPSRRQRRLVPERLEERAMFAFMGAWDTSAHLLSITGTDQTDNGVLSHDARGNILLDGTPTGAALTTTAKIQILGHEGNDKLTIDTRNGYFAPGYGEQRAGEPHITFSFHGGSGQDTLIIKGLSNSSRTINGEESGPISDKDFIDLGVNERGQTAVNFDDDDDVDLIATSVENFTVYGGTGDDVLRANGNNLVGGPLGIGVKFYGEAGVDILNGGKGGDTLHGGPGDDDLFGGEGDDKLLGAGGDDYLFGAEGDDTLVGGYGDDSLDGRHGADWLYGGPGDDELTGFYGDDRLWGDAGHDLLEGGRGNDRLEGGEGDDVLYGREELMYGDDSDADNDTLKGDGGNDKLYGQLGHDELRGGDGNDLLSGGEDPDLLYGDAGSDQLLGDMGADTLYGGDGNDVLRGYYGIDVLYGDAGNDRLFGEKDSDVLFGGDGQDALFGGDWDAADVLNGGLHADRLLTQPGDFVLGLTSADARIHFVDSDTTTASGFEWSAASWEDEEIEWVDDAFEVVHRWMNNTALLKMPDGGMLTFYRRGIPDGETGILGWNSGGGSISINEQCIQAGEGWVRRSVYHELAHNWQSDAVNPTWSSFVAVSDWVQSGNSPGQEYTQGLDDDTTWWYLTGTEFARNYGKTAPGEDWATCVEIFFHNAAGDTLGDKDSLPESKLSLVEDFLESLM